MRALRTALILCVFSSAHIFGADAFGADAVSYPSANFIGVVGLNNVPSARMEKAGTARVSMSAADPYLHTQIGFQPHDRAYLGFRQTGESGSVFDEAKHLYPGMDLKLKLIDERSYRPQMAIGLQSALGHKRLAAEYLVLSKRYENFDFTAGLGWGRLGTGNQVMDPLFFNRLRGDGRDLDGEDPNSPSDWFRGDAGVFGGIEYNLPWEGFSLKADWTSDDYKAERGADDGFSAPKPYALSLNYTGENFDAGIGAQGTDILLARFSLKGNFADWPLTSSTDHPLAPVLPRGDRTQPDLVLKDAEAYGLHFKSLQVSGSGMTGALHLEPFSTTPRQLGQGWRIMANHSQRQAESLSLTPSYLGLKGHDITINRRDLEQEAKLHHGSAEEIWRNLSADPSKLDLSSDMDLSSTYLTFKQEISPSEEDNGILHRNALLLTNSNQIWTNFLTESSLRLNIFHNLDRLHKLRPYSANPTRSDVDFYTERPLSLERSYFKGFKTLLTDLHAGLSFGYLEEMFGGLQAEILYRPWGRNWAIGADAARVRKRDYQTAFNLGFMKDVRITSLAHAYYEIPNSDFTISLDAGRYLAGDTGAGLTLKNRFDNGATLEAFVTATNKKDPDVYGDDTNIYSGVRFSLPFGSLKYLPDGSSAEVTVAPFGRDAGQKLDTPHPLYETTESLSYRHLAQNWKDVTRAP